MPVLITGASCDVGRRLAAMLRDQDAQVRAYVGEDDASLRSLGVHVAIGEYDDLGRIESACEQVHTLVHLVGGAEPAKGWDLERWNVESAEIAVRAADGADVSRFLMLSEVGADEGSRNEYLAARGRADDLVMKSKLAHAILRCAPIVAEDTPFGRAMREARNARTPVAPGDGTQRLNPVAAADVARALLVLDDREATPTGVLELGGPETQTYDELIMRATNAARIAHRRSVPGLPRVLADAYASDRIAVTSPALGFEPSRVGW